MRNNVEGPCSSVHCLPQPKRPPPAQLHDQYLSCCLTLENDDSQHCMCTALWTYQSASVFVYYTLNYCCWCWTMSLVHSHMMWFDWLSLEPVQGLVNCAIMFVNNVISVPLEGIWNTVCTCWVSMEWSNWWTGMETVVYCPPFLCLSLRHHSYCGECERGDGRDRGLGESGELALCPILQATGDQSTVIYWGGEVSGTGRLLGQHCPWCILGETCHGALPVWRGENTSSDKTILAARYV